MSLSETNRSLLDTWNARYSDAKKWREEDLCFDARCLKVRAFIKGAHWGEDKPTDCETIHESDHITINLMGSWVRVDMPDLYSHNPIAKVTPTSRGYSAEARTDEQLRADIIRGMQQAGKNPGPQGQFSIGDYDLLRINSKLVEAGINDVLLELEDFNRKSRLALKDTYSGIGVLKTYYEPLIDANPKYGEALLNSLGEPVIDPETGEEILDDLDEVFIGDKFVVERVDCLNIFVPVDSTPFPGDIPWFIERIPTTVGKVVGNDNYSAAARAELTKHYKMKNASQSKEWRDDKTELLLVWDIENDEHLVYLKDGPLEDKAILQKAVISEDFPGMPGHPYAFLNFVDSEYFWSDPPYGFDAIGPQVLYNRLSTAMLKIAEAYKPIIQVNMDLLYDDDDFKKIKDNKVDYVPTAGDAIIPSKSVAIPPAILAMRASAKSEFDGIVNQTQQARGVTGEANFAAEIQSSEIHTRQVGDYKRDLVSEFYAKVVKNIFYLLKANAEEGDETVIRPVIIDITNKETGESTKIKTDLRRAHLDLEVDLKIDVVSRSAKQMGQDRANMNEFLMSFNNNQELLANQAIRQRFIDMLGLDPELNNQIQRAIDKRLEQAQQIQQQQAQTSEKANQAKLAETKMELDNKAQIAQSEQQMKVQLQKDKSDTEVLKALIGQMDKLPSRLQAELLLVIEPELNRLTNVIDITASIEAKKIREEAASAAKGKTEETQSAVA